jgi:hypothetical protein
MSPAFFFPLAVMACLLCTHCGPTGPATAPNPAAKPVNQLAIAGNACGPAALLNALRFGSAAHQSAAAVLPGDSDRSHLRHIIIEHGSKASRNLRGQRRWSRRGINATDLCDVTNELLRNSHAGSVKLTLPGGIHSLAPSHSALARSLRLGFPPVVSLRRYQGGLPIDSHFVTILQVPDALDPHAESFSFRYVDPMGARTLHGTLRIHFGKTQQQLIAEVPHTPVGLQKAKGSSYLLMDALIVAP